MSLVPANFRVEVTPFCASPQGLHVSKGHSESEKKLNIFYVSWCMQVLSQKMLHAPVGWKGLMGLLGKGMEYMGYWASQLQVMETPEPEEQWKWVSPHPVHPKRCALKQPLVWGTLGQRHQCQMQQLIQIKINRARPF